MLFEFTIKPNQISDEQIRIRVDADGCLSYTAAYVGAYTYCNKLQVDNGVEFTLRTNRINYNLQIGKYNSIGIGMNCIFARNHNYKNVSTGAVKLMLKKYGVKMDVTSTYHNKASILVQNDVWFGENVTVMPGVIVRNGAVIARNSHVVSDVPPYAIVGGNPAKVIGYRYSQEVIDKLQKIAWWDWTDEKIVENAAYFTEDIETFCNTFYEEANKEFEEYVCRRNIKEDVYFMFVDYYENYSIFSTVLEEFLDMYISDGEKKLLLFVQEDVRVGKIDEDLYDRLNAILEEIKEDSTILCSVEMVRGTFEDAKEAFLNCSHYIATRTYDTIPFSCLADKLGVEIISGVDDNIQFVKSQNMYKSHSQNEE